jgi:hypothetical protein
MFGLLDVIVFDVWDYPDIPGILTQRIPRKLTDARTLESLLIRVLLRNSNCIEVKCIAITLGKPQDGFMPTGQSAVAV